MRKSRRALAALSAVCALASCSADDARHPGPPPAAKPDTAIRSLDLLQRQIVEALAATQWPPLKPSLARVANGPLFDPALLRCPSHVGVVAPEGRCEWGSGTAQTRVVLVGDSVAQGYAGPLSQIADGSGGGIWFLDMAMGSCSFTAGLVDRQPTPANCDAWKQHVVQTIDTVKPDVVLISNQFTAERFVGSPRIMTTTEWTDSLRQMVDRIRAATKKVAFIAYPPGWLDPKSCAQPTRKHPADCIGRVTAAWTAPALAEQDLARQIGAIWIDSRPWFCSAAGLCPSFVATTPTKRDIVHMAPEYGQQIYPVIQQSLTAAGVL